MNNIMVDLETWGTKPGSDIRSIGAVEFDDEYRPLGRTFYVNLKSGSDYGLVRDQSTVKWWSEQSDEAQSVLLQDQVPFKQGLEMFRDWWLEIQEGPATREDYTKFWANGSHFDYVLLNAAYEAVGLDVPWIYRAPRDCKTIWDAGGDPNIPFEGVPHNALDDAVHQARCVVEAFKNIKG